MTTYNYLKHCRKKIRKESSFVSYSVLSFLCHWLSSPFERWRACKNEQICTLTDSRFFITHSQQIRKSPSLCIMRIIFRDIEYNWWLVAQHPTRRHWEHRAICNVIRHIWKIQWLLQFLHYYAVIVACRISFVVEFIFFLFVSTVPNRKLIHKNGENQIYYRKKK